MPEEKNNKAILEKSEKNSGDELPESAELDEEALENISGGTACKVMGIGFEGPRW